MGPDISDFANQYKTLRKRYKKTPDSALENATEHIKGLQKKYPILYHAVEIPASERAEIPKGSTQKYTKEKMQSELCRQALE